MNHRLLKTAALASLALLAALFLLGPVRASAQTATPSPSPAPGGDFEIEADLTGAAINGVVPKGDAEFHFEGGQREFRVRVEEVNLPAGTPLDVFVDGVGVGSLSVAPSLDRSELKLKTEDRQMVPQLNSRTRVVVATRSGQTVVAGSFSNIAQPVPNPNPAPMPTPGPNGETRILARLAGATINGLTPTGKAEFKRKLNGDRSIEVEVERLNLPAGTILGVFVDGVRLGDLILRPTLENELELETERGQSVPDITTASRVVVTNAQGQTVLSGVFNSAGLATTARNDVDDTVFFVEQQYRDFLGREADDDGLRHWTDDIRKCAAGDDPACVQRMRVNTSGAFFLSIEFQETGYMLYLFNKASFGTMPRRNHFLVEMQATKEGVIVGQEGWRERLDANQRAAADRWVARAEFRQVFDSLTDDQYVDRLYQNAGVQPAPSVRDALVRGLSDRTETRATVLRRVADTAEFVIREKNPAFVLMQYFGYLHRNPDEGQDGDLSGFNHWLTQLNNAGGDFHRAELVRAFIESIEYRKRFEW